MTASRGRKEKKQFFSRMVQVTVARHGARHGRARGGEAIVPERAEERSNSLLERKGVLG